MGNREVPRIEILSLRADVSAAQVVASPGEERGAWGKPGFPHATEPKAKEEAA
jgi:hypothetical protein